MSETKQSFFSTSYLAKRLNVTTRTIQRLIKKGEIPGLKVGKKYIIPRAYIDKLDALENKE